MANVLKTSIDGVYLVTPLVLPPVLPRHAIAGAKLFFVLDEQPIDALDILEVLYAMRAGGFSGAQCVLLLCPGSAVDLGRPGYAEASREWASSGGAVEICVGDSSKYLSEYSLDGFRAFGAEHLCRELSSFLAAVSGEVGINGATCLSIATRENMFRNLFDPELRQSIRDGLGIEQGYSLLLVKETNEEASD